MSQQLNAATQDYVAKFGDFPTIIGMTDEDALQEINAAIKEGKPIELPTQDGEVDIYI